MSWLWGSETTEQAQIVVGALQSELDEREQKIKALESELRQEQQEFRQVVLGEIQELEDRKKKIEDELVQVNELIKQKLGLLDKDKNTKKKKPVMPAKPENIANVEEKRAETKAEKQMELSQKKSGEEEPEKKFSHKMKCSKKEVITPVDALVEKVVKVEPNVAFIIQRSTNSNTVVYSGKVRGKGPSRVIDSEKPLDVYWIMYEKEGHPREDLNMIERNSAYGASCAPSPENKTQFIVTLSALKDRKIKLFLDASGKVQARSVINGKNDMILRRVFVQMTSSWGMPAVDYIEIFGVNPITMESVYEKKSNK